jgi:hypothetical protein
MEGIKRDELEIVVQGCACLGTWYLGAHLVYISHLWIAKATKECSRLSKENTGVYCLFWLLVALVVFLSHMWVLVLGHMSI